MYRTNYKYYIPQNIHIFYHFHTSQEISNTHTKSPSHGRHKLLILNPFLKKHKYFLEKPMEGNTIHNFKITKRALSRRNSFDCVIKGTNLTSLYTQLDILSLPPVAPIFPLQS